MAALSALLSNHGVLTDSFAIPPNFQVGLAAIQIPENLITRLAPPESPPPRA
jgi:hypothetical protein